MLRLLAAFILALSLLVAGGSAVPATAAKAGCVTFKEFKKVKAGMTRRHVERKVFGTTRSWLADGAAGGYTRSYMSCDRQHAAFVEYGVRKRGGVAKATGFKRWTAAS